MPKYPDSKVPVQADQDVLQGGQVLEEANVLIGAGDATPDDLVGQQAHQGVVVEHGYRLLSGR